MLILFSLAMFFGAILLFMVEPMFGKMALPFWGGSPAVWNTCMVFYQGALLAGYLYAHLAPKWLGVRRQAAFHLGLLVMILFTLPIGISHGWAPPIHASPVAWLLLVLLFSVGLPFFVVSTTAPLLQKWFAQTSHAFAHDPYFLYGASNLGSLLSLVVYPTIIEPYLRLHHQSWAWAVGYLVLIGLLSLCGVVVWRAPAQTGSAPSVQNSGAASVDADTRAVAKNSGRFTPHPLPSMGEGKKKEKIFGKRYDSPASSLSIGQRVWWVLLAFAPSSLLLGVTTFLSTDIASAPLLWIIPLIIYLLSFVLVFARKPLIPHRVMVFLEPFVIIPLSVCFFMHFKAALWQTLPFHLLAFFIIAMVCHGELMNSRPPVEYLTEFYLWISVGGVLGGIFNALLAPVLFSELIEYPLIIVLACLLRPSLDTENQKSRKRRWDILLPLILGVFLVLLCQEFQTLPDRFKIPALLATAGAAGTFCYSFRFRPLRLGLGLGVLILAGTWFIGQHERVLFKERNFFGVAKVTADDAGHYHILTHGSTIHGAQSLDMGRRREPLTYYHRSGPLGQIFEVFSAARAGQEVAVIGLGTGTIACYAQAGQYFTFYEIDPAMERIALDPRYFTYLPDCPAHVKIILGDARLSLKAAPDYCYDMIILDAFSSDAIPIHLLTQEALRLYLAKLKPEGILVFHISNRFLDLKPVLGNLAREAGIISLEQSDLKLSDEEIRNRKTASEWVVMARTREVLGGLTRDQRWHTLPVRPEHALWTDDFSNILSVFKWKSIRLNDWISSISKYQ